MLETAYACTHRKKHKKIINFYKIALSNPLAFLSFPHPSSCSSPSSPNGFIPTALFCYGMSCPQEEWGRSDGDKMGGISNPSMSSINKWLPPYVPISAGFHSVFPAIHTNATGFVLGIGHIFTHFVLSFRFALFLDCTRYGYLPSTWFIA